MKKSVFLTKGKKDMIASGQYDEYIFASPVYRFDNTICKILARINVKLRLPFLVCFLGDWAKNILDYDLIICEGLKGRSWVFEYILKHKKEGCRVIMWHWNKIYENEINPQAELAMHCEQWSFDADDCKQYNMHFNTQYYMAKEADYDNLMKWDLYFVGSDKNRAELIKKIEQYCRSINLMANFHVVADDSSKVSTEERFYRKPISYEDNIKNVIHSKAILDVPLKGQHGLTLRVLEALYFQKKLITFNSDVKNLVFYNGNNILVCHDETDIELIGYFLQQPYVDTEECVEARKYYSFKEWMKRFWRLNSD